MRYLSNERGFTFVELLAVVLLLGILILVALPNYFGAESNAKSSVDQANVRAINTAIALFQFKNNGACPTADGSGSGTEIDVFLATTTYFPDGVPLDPYTSTSTPYISTYNATLCRIMMNSGGIDHRTGAGH